MDSDGASDKVFEIEDDVPALSLPCMEGVTKCVT